MECDFEGADAMKLEGKRALITGGTKGIGAAIAVDLAQQGADIAINARNEDETVAEVRGQIESAGRRCAFIQADMASPDEIETCVRRAADALGGLDILIHNAGGSCFGTIDQITPDDWNYTFAVHVDAAYHLCRHALPILRRNSAGVIILVSSVAGLRGCPGAIAYGTAKGAILQFTRMLARDVSDDNIRVNCVAPGVIRTRFHEKMTPEQKAHNLAVRIPLHREGTPQDVAEAVRLLVTSEFMTGETIVIDGGTSMQVVR
jgi:NAD(P)-dependent dehydrogenase (short-subunit alcohol dehydrogenase family)